MSGQCEVVAVLLAGGEARRMGGGDKCRLDLAGRSLLEHVRARIAPQVGAMVLNANGRPERFADTGLAVVADSIAGSAGPLAGVLAGLDWAREAEPRASHVVSVATDTPFFPRSLVAGLRARLAVAPAQIACAVSGGRVHPVFALWPVDLADDLRAALAAGLRKVDVWTAQHGVAYAHFGPAGDAGGLDPFFNINRREDLDIAARQLAGSR